MTSSQDDWPAGPVDWARSPRIVSDPLGQRRATADRASAERSCASSTTTWPTVAGSPFSSELAVSSSTWSAGVHRFGRPVRVRTRAWSSALRSPSAAEARTSGRESSRSTRARGRTIGQARASAARTFGTSLQTPSRPVRRRNACSATTRSDSRRRLSGWVPARAAEIHSSTCCGSTTTLVEPQRVPDRLGRRADLGEGGPLEDRDHDRPTLDPCRGDRVVPGHFDPGDGQLADRALLHRPLAERREARWRCSRGKPGSVRPRGRPRGPAAGGARTAGRRRGAARRRSCPSRGRPAR